MKISKPSELKKFLEENQLVAKKASSQNFLIDGNILRKIVKEAELSSEDVVLEIGPGPGALTEALLETGCLVVAIEKDDSFAALLTKRLVSPETKLKVISSDFLKTPLEPLLSPFQNKAKVVANLPYHITTPILTRLLPLHALFSDLILMVQKEVALRFVAEVGSKEYSSFTLFLQFYSEARYCFTVEPTCFQPKPSVQSAVIHLRLRPPPFLEEQERFFQLTRTAFKQRRKMLRASLKPLFSAAQIENALQTLHLRPTSRPEELSLSQFLQLYALLIEDQHSSF